MGWSGAKVQSKLLVGEEGVGSSGYKGGGQIPVCFSEMISCVSAVLKLWSWQDFFSLMKRDVNQRFKEWASLVFHRVNVKRPDSTACVWCIQNVFRMKRHWRSASVLPGVWDRNRVVFRMLLNSAKLFCILSRLFIWLKKKIPADFKSVLVNPGDNFKSTSTISEWSI